MLGGSFNPPHGGHVRLAEEAVSGLELDRLVVIPAGRAPHKDEVDDPGAEIRLRMCEAAFAGLPRVEVSRIELDREGPSWTADTLGDLAAADPGAEFFLVLGEDMAASLDSWREPERIVSLATIAWAPRSGAGSPGEGRGRIAELVAGLGGGDVVELQMEPVDLSSTAVRESFLNGEGGTELVSGGVLEVIESLGLYGAGAGEAAA